MHKTGKTALSLIFLTATILILLPMMSTSVMAADITSVYVNVTHPIIGEKPDTVNYTSNNAAAYTIKDIAWFSGGHAWDPTGPMTSANTFALGTTYLCRVAVVPNEGYYLPEKTEVLINGFPTDCSVRDPVNGGGLFTAYLPALYKDVGWITSDDLKLTVVPPKVGETVSYAISVPSDGKFTAKITHWQTFPFNQKLSQGDIYKAGESYKCYIAITPNPGYILRNPLATRANVNGSTTFSPDILWTRPPVFTVYQTFATPRELKSVAAVVTEPVTEAMPTTTATFPDSGGYITAESVKWVNVAVPSGTETPVTGAFEAGKSYRCYITATLGTSSYFFPSTATATINGKDAVMFAREEKTLTFFVAFKTPAKPAEEIVITQQPKSVSVKPGETASFSITATGDELHYQWYLAGTGATNAVGSDLPSLTLPSVSISQNGFTVWCVVRDKDGKALMSDLATLRVKEPSDYLLPFADVPVGVWFRKDVEVAHKNGLINGKTPTSFVPYDNITVGEVVKLAACMHQFYYNGVVTLDNSPTAPWYKTYMAYALEKGIIDIDLTAEGERLVTRAEAVYIFYKALPVSEYPVINSVADGAIPDVDGDNAAAQRIYIFYRAGILIGNDDKGSFLPNNFIQRCEVAAMLTRMFDKTERMFCTF